MHANLFGDATLFADSFEGLEPGPWLLWSFHPRPWAVRWGGRAVRWGGRLGGPFLQMHHFSRDHDYAIQ